ncbi:MAG: cell division protein ZapD [Sulfuricella sp.]|jgi:cell division protein ZapD|nr:cell division protein ZapD [Sulfuricella sp.]
MISYDYPLNERVRTLLRLEDLYARVDFFITRPHAMDHHAALLSLFEILEVASRADLKTDLLQELERQKQILELLRHNPVISEEALEDILRKIVSTATSLHEMSGKMGQHIRDNEWLMSIKQRINIPGGACEFDLPSYHYWLNTDEEARRKDLREWLAPLQPVNNGLLLVLKLLRDSGKTTRQKTHHGAFQQMLAGRAAQMIRITLDKNLPCFPEISANKYAINIRFTSLGGTQKSRTCDINLDFDLTLCNF